MNKPIHFVSSVLCGIFLSTSTALAAPDDPVTVMARFYATPGREAEVEALFQKEVVFVRKAEPGITYRLYRSLKDPTEFVFYEVYANQAAAEIHSKVTLPAVGKEFGPPPEGLFARPPEIGRFTALTN